MTHIQSELYRIQGAIIRLKRQSKKEWGAKSEWPDFVRERYRALKSQARECREALGEAA